MRIHEIMLVRDEADIIGQSLEHLLTWCDSIHVYDTGSTDGTWEIVNEIARRDRRVNPMARETVRYVDGLRAYVFGRIRRGFEPGDWVARLDADEMSYGDGRAWLAANTSRMEGRVRPLFFEFVLRASEAAAWERGGESVADRGRPIEARRRWYYIDPYPEVRAFRYRRWMKWPADRTVPLSCGLTAFERWPIRHYRCRDPLQVRRRCAVRAAMAEMDPRWAHWRRDWRYWVWPDEDPRLRLWREGEDLPVPRSPRSARGTWPYLTRRAYYGSGAAAIADLFRRGLPRGSKPPALTEEQQRRIAATVAGFQPMGGPLDEPRMK